MPFKVSGSSADHLRGLTSGLGACSPVDASSTSPKAGAETLGQPRSLGDDVGPQAPADTERRKEPKPGAPGGLCPPRAQDHLERSGFTTRERQRDDESVQKDRDRDPDGGEAAMSAADHGASDLDLGEADEEGEHRRARPEEHRAGSRERPAGGRRRRSRDRAAARAQGGEGGRSSDLDGSRVSFPARRGPGWDLLGRPSPGGP